MNHRTLLPLLLALALLPACQSNNSSGDDDTDAGTDTDTDADTDSDTDSDTDTDTETDTETDTDTDPCQYLYDLVVSLCGSVLPQMIECCNTVWDQVLDLDAMLACAQEAINCEDLWDCDAEAAYCDPLDCPAATIDCAGFYGDPSDIYDVWLCCSWWAWGETPPFEIQICDLGECVPQEVIRYELCGPDGFEPCAGGLVDTATGLCWQNPAIFETMDWGEANDYCQGLTLEGHDDWRLPTVGELRTLVSGWASTEIDGACGVSDACLASYCLSTDCDGDDYLGGPGLSGCYWSPALSGECHPCWSQSQVEDLSTAAWIVDFGFGRIFYSQLTQNWAARCVRTAD